MKTKIENLKRPDILGSGDCSSDQEILAAVLKRWRQKLGYCSIFAAVPAILASHVTAARSDEVKKPEASVAGRTVRLRDRLSNSSSNPALLKGQREYRLPHQKGSFDMLDAFSGNDNCPGLAIPGGTYTAAAPFTGTGDTTGANDTVTNLPSYYYYSYNAHGPDQIYTFTLTGLGPHPQIKVSTTSGTYSPLIYVLQGGPAGACPSGTGNTVSNELMISWAFGGTSTTDISFLPLN